jgi:DNA-binding transcriptional regulator YhcF (GntR family)
MDQLRVSDMIVDEVFDNITKHVRKKGYPPSRRDLAEMCGVSVASVQRALQCLHETGRIVVIPNVARGVLVVDQQETF